MLWRKVQAVAACAGGGVLVAGSGARSSRGAERVAVNVCACARVGAQKADNARERVRVRVIARNALLARCSGLWRVLACCPIDNSSALLRRLKTAYRALKKNQKNLQKSVDKRRRWVYNALDG